MVFQHIQRSIEQRAQEVPDLGLPERLLDIELRLARPRRNSK